jgi:hypothetical protein
MSGFGLINRLAAYGRAHRELFGAALYQSDTPLCGHGRSHRK